MCPRVLVMVHSKLCLYSNVSVQISQVEKWERYASQNLLGRSPEKMYPWGEAEITGTVQGAVEIKYNTDIPVLKQFCGKFMDEIPWTEISFWYKSKVNHTLKPHKLTWLCSSSIAINDSTASAVLCWGSADFPPLLVYLLHIPQCYHQLKKVTASLWLPNSQVYLLQMRWAPVRVIETARVTAFVTKVLSGCHCCPYCSTTAAGTAWDVSSL